MFIIVDVFPPSTSRNPNSVHAASLHLGFAASPGKRHIIECLTRHQSDNPSGQSLPELLCWWLLTLGLVSVKWRGPENGAASIRALQQSERMRIGFVSPD